MRHVVGCMTGTSLDGLDAALVQISGHGLAVTARFVRGQSVPLGALTEPLRDLAEQRPLTAGAIAAVMRDFALLHAAAVRELLAGEACDLVAVHGQTVFHAPPLSWQLFQPAPLAQALGVPVICDLRAADLAAGGQGAPITPLSDWLLLRQPGTTRVVVNLGGFCNLTILPDGGPELIRGSDVCACNQLLDAIARRCFASAFDADGARALGASADVALIAELSQLLSAQRHAQRSLGTGDELIAVVERLAAHHDGAVLARSACAAIAVTIRAAGGDGQYVLAGGGVRNRALRNELAQHCPMLCDSDAVGVPGAWREAIAMAVLGTLCQDGVPITLPAVTGVRHAPNAGLFTSPSSPRESSNGGLGLASPGTGL